MSVLKGDYIGFSYNGKHSSELGIIRTSDGSRFNENLLPSVQDKVVQVPGGDGSYFLGSQFSAKEFSISYAFDLLTEQQLQELKAVFGDKKIHPLIFDEIPYKTYMAKVTGSATIKYLAFDQEVYDEERQQFVMMRVYKGEGSIQFTAYTPFARATHKFLGQYTEAQQAVSEEWNGAAKLLISQGNFDKLNDNQILLYNPGNIESDFVLTINFVNGKIPASKISVDNNGEIFQLAFKEISANGQDACLKINSKTNLFEGFDHAGRKTGNIYNRAILAGTFFKIPITLETSNPIRMVFENSNNITANLSKEPLEYDYIYF